MSGAEPSLPEKIVAIDECLAAARMPHAFGGALALAYYAEPRSTIDIDLNVFLAPSEHRELLAALRPLGIETDAGAGSVERDGQWRVWWQRTPIDLFFAYDELHGAMREATRSVPFGDAALPILAPEHLVVCKAIFDRPKDWLDIEQVLVCTETFDVAETHAWLERIAGTDDPRTARFDQLAAENVG